MEERVLRVRMLGEFSIALGAAKVDDKASRSRKVWLLLAYLIHNRDKTVSQEELVNVLWGNERNDNPFGALKTTLWRARRVLAALEPTAGHELILTGEGGYRWNPKIPTQVDAEEFEALCRAGTFSGEEELRLEQFRKAMPLYQGDFLSKLSAEPWVEPITAYYHNLYLNTVLELLPLLRASAEMGEAVRLCRMVLQIAPYHEGLYQHLMLSLLEMGDYKRAAEVYEEMRELLFSDLGILPDEASQSIYQEILRNVSGHVLSPDMIREQLREKNPPAGALICDYAFFKLHYQAEARAAIRRGDAIHVGVLTVTDRDGEALSRRRLDRVMENLRVLIQESLRRGDVAARCSASQYIVLLLQANYENSCMVCERIAAAYARAYPHSWASIRCSVLPLEPLLES